MNTKRLSSGIHQIKDQEGNGAMTCNDDNDNNNNDIDIDTMMFDVIDMEYGP